ncbi:MAG: class I poly(R)-hydroxyalkanoic acid synthase [Pseudorhodoplanes sp.]|jgi:polyhydroxyalkanoate synthase|nr:class I poly(R)-hydroxyalkanoic acid synthase [Pseudorhodoplanes sp.]
MMNKVPEKPVVAEDGTVDVERFAGNLARFVEEGGKALAAYLKPREEGRARDDFADQINDAVKTLGQVLEYWLSDPQRSAELQISLGRSYLELWGSAAKRLAGETVEPVAKADPKDRRFADPEWSSNLFFDFLKQLYLLSTDWADRLVRNADGLDPHTRQKAEFYIRQITNALSPSNFVLTNPELLRETLTSNAENLVRGMQMLSEDIDPHGHINIRQSDPSIFELGRNLALTPGKVIFQNELMQLIQYAPATEAVLKTPLLIVPPWINKFYVLDLTPEKSYIRWCVDQGLTVFVISWVNPDERLADKGFENYMREGPLAALDAIRDATGESKVHTVGYCVGGTLLAITLAYMAATNDDRILSATFFAAQVDFRHAGDLKVFVDEEQLKALEQKMQERGYLDGRYMKTAFNLLRSNDLIWPYIINNYLKGKAPFPFDLLHWNSDATRMPAANHSFYLRSCYLNNLLTRGQMEIGGVRLDLKKVTVPIYDLATREDHIAPAKSVFLGAQYFGGPVRFVLSGSGHIAGVVNPVAKAKYQYWVGDTPAGEFEDWMTKAVEHKGSWWPDWLAWIVAQNVERVPARKPGSGKLKPIEDAPGSYVRVRS